MAITDIGDMSFDIVDALNIPTEILICEGDGNNDSDGTWSLIAGCYQPRKCKVIVNAFHLRADDRSELEVVVRERIKPLYAAMVARLEGLAVGGRDTAFLWSD